jgi:ParB-like chromosome segregation protein Spo0J
MNDIGLQTPISVRWVKDEGDEASHLELVAGATRLGAAIELEWGAIDCFIVDPKDVDYRIWEIDENLFRAELTAAEIAVHTKRRKELWLEETGGKSLPTSLSDGRAAAPQHAKGFSADTAHKTGRTKRSVNIALSRAKNIAPDVLDAVAGTPLDKGTSLDALAKLPHDEQRAAVAAGELPRASAPDPAVQKSDERADTAAQTADNAAGADQRCGEIPYIDTAPSPAPADQFRGETTAPPESVGGESQSGAPPGPDRAQTTAGAVSTGGDAPSRNPALDEQDRCVPVDERVTNGDYGVLEADRSAAIAETDARAMAEHLSSMAVRNAGMTTNDALQQLAADMRELGSPEDWYRLARRANELSLHEVAFFFAYAADWDPPA